MGKGRRKLRNRRKEKNRDKEESEPMGREALSDNECSTEAEVQSNRIDRLEEQLSQLTELLITRNERSSVQSTINERLEQTSDARIQEPVQDPETESGERAEDSLTLPRPTKKEPGSESSRELPRFKSSFQKISLNESGVAAKILFLYNTVKAMQKNYEEQSLLRAFQAAIPYEILMSLNPSGTCSLETILGNVKEKYNSPLLLEQEEKGIESFRISKTGSLTDELMRFIQKVDSFKQYFSFFRAAKRVLWTFSAGG